MSFADGMKTYYDSMELSPAQFDLICEKLKDMKLTKKEKKILDERAGFISYIEYLKRVEKYIENINKE